MTTLPKRLVVRLLLANPTLLRTALSTQIRDPATAAVLAGNHRFSLQ